MRKRVRKCRLKAADTCVFTSRDPRVRTFSPCGRRCHCEAMTDEGSTRSGLHIFIDSDGTNYIRDGRHDIQRYFSSEFAVPATAPPPCPAASAAQARASPAEAAPSSQKSAVADCVRAI